MPRVRQVWSSSVRPDGISKIDDFISSDVGLEAVGSVIATSVAEGVAGMTGGNLGLLRKTLNEEFARYAESEHKKRLSPPGLLGRAKKYAAGPAALSPLYLGGTAYSAFASSLASFGLATLAFLGASAVLGGTAFLSERRDSHSRAYSRVFNKALKAYYAPVSG